MPKPDESTTPFRVVTNNPVTADAIKGMGFNCDVKWVASSAVEVLTAVRIAIQKGAKLIGSPLVGEFDGNPTALNPYISVLLSTPSDALDFPSMKKVEHILKLYRNNAKARFAAHDSSVEYFQFVDMNTILTTLAAISSK